MQYVFKSVHELTPDEVRRYLELYNSTFDRDLSYGEFYYKFTRQMGPNSYFVFMVDDQAGIVGSLGAIEVDYTFGGEQLKFGLTVDAMIEPEYRELLAMRRQHEVLFEELKRRGFGWVFTKPNNNSYLYLKKLLGFSDAGELRAYAFPIRPFRALGRRLGFLDYPWLALLLLSGWLAHPLRPFKDVSLDELHLDTGKATCIQRERNAEFLRNRYGSERYHAVALNDRYLIFSTNAYGRRSACFALEAHHMGLRDWLAFITYTVLRHPEADVVLRITGEARKQSLPLIRIPRRFLPNKFRIVVKTIGDRVLPSDVEFRMDLSDFEVI